MLVIPVHPACATVELTLITQGNIKKKSFLGVNATQEQNLAPFCYKQNKCTGVWLSVFHIRNATQCNILCCHTGELNLALFSFPMLAGVKNKKQQLYLIRATKAVRDNKGTRLSAKQPARRFHRLNKAPLGAPAEERFMDF